jgi:hypothetical protein
MPIYVNATDVKGKAIDERITRAGWSDADINKCIDEAESYVEGKLIRLGYTRQQLLTAPSSPAPLLKQLCILYSRYCIIRDIFTNIAPNVSAGDPYDKWKTAVNEIIGKIEKNDVRMVDNNGLIINPIAGDSRFKIETTTKNVIRAIRISDVVDWRLDPTYEDEEVIGKADGL